MNSPLGILDVILVFLFVPNLRSEEAGRQLDIFGLLSSSAFLTGLIIFTGKGQPERWLTNDFVLSMFLLTLAGFVAYATYTTFFNESAVIPLRLFRQGNFTLGNISLFFSTMSAYGFILMETLLLQRLHGYTTVQAGLILFPSAICMAVGSLAAGIISDKHSPKLLAIFGLVLSGIFGWRLKGSLRLTEGQLIAQFLFWGFFNGVAVAPSALIILGDLKKEDTNIGSSTLNVARLVAGCIGTAFTTALLSSRTAMF